MVGKTISHYKVIEKLGEGGMGVVYKAEDTKLKRLVALKFLPREFIRDREAKKRFIHEAQAASALEHNNICNIHEIDETEDGQLFIIMAHYEGETLKGKIEQGPLGIAELMDIAIQIGEGLAAAHEADITHRDIKPANIMLTKRGEVKILDFGLAKLRGQTRLTKEGTTLGTAAYMSPEQAQGQEVDQRTDIFSLGVLLYEMLTGQQPFRGDYESAVFYAILNETPEPITGLRTGVPIELERVVFKCLEKAPEERYQSATDLLVDLKKLKKTLEKSKADSIDSATATEDIQTGSRRKGISILTATALGSLVVILAILAYFNLQPKDTVPHFRNPKRITSALGLEDHPTWSPEGGRLAYDSNQSGNRDIWVTQVTGGLPVNLTADHLGTDMSPSWSPDGSQIAFWSDRDGGGIFVMSALGGIPRKIISVMSSPTGFFGYPQWSKDGIKLACIVRDTAGFSVEIVSLSTRSSQRLPLPGTQPNRGDLNWSPDNRAFAYMDWYYKGVVGPVRVMRLADGKSILVSDSLSIAQNPFWSPDGRFLNYLSEGDIWQQRLRTDFVPEGPPQRLTTGIGMDRGIGSAAAFSPDGKKLAYSKGRSAGNLWSVPVPGPLDQPKTWADARQLTFDQSMIAYVDLSPDRQRLLFDSRRTGNWDLWMMSLLGDTLQQLTTDPAMDLHGMWSPNGQEIAFHSARSGNRDIWVMPTSGGRARQLTQHEAEDMWPQWSPDGREIAFGSHRSGNWDVWIIRSTGGEARQVTSHSSRDRHPQWSPDGKWLVFDSQRESDFPRLWRVPAEGGQPELLTEEHGQMPHWSRQSNRLYFKRNIEGTLTLWELSLENGRERQVLDLKSRPGMLHPNTLATDGKRLFFTWEEYVGDIWVMDVEKK